MQISAGFFAQNHFCFPQAYYHHSSSITCQFFNDLKNEKWIFCVSTKSSLSSSGERRILCGKAKSNYPTSTKPTSAEKSITADIVLLHYCLPL
jgi:hypothetical protein